MDNFTYPPFAYYLLIENPPRWYTTLLKVARKDLKMELKEIHPNENPGSDYYILIPSNIPDSRLPEAISEEEQIARDAIAARRILRVPNRFLYYSFSGGDSFETTGLLGMTIIYNIKSLAYLCCELPSRLAEHEIQGILEYGVAFGLISEARYLLHELDKLESVGKPIAPLMPAIVDCLNKAMSAGLLEKDKISKDEKSEIAVAGLRTALSSIEGKIDAEAFNRSPGR